MADISIAKLLDHFNKRFDSLENSINAVRQDFNTFEAGRLTDLTAKVAVLEEQQSKDDNNILKTLAFEVLKAIILALVAGMLYLLLKNPVGL